MDAFLRSLEYFFQEILRELSSFFTHSLENGDKFLLALVLLLLGWGIGQILENLIVRIAERHFIARITHKSGFPELLKRAGVERHPSRVIGQFLKGYIFTLFVLKASQILGINTIADFLTSVTAYIPKMIVALVIVLFGIRVAETTAAIIESGFRLVESKSGKILSIVAKGVIITFTILAALVQLEIASDLVRVLFIGFVTMIALSGGLAFGLGGKRVVEEFLEDIRSESLDAKKNLFQKGEECDTIEEERKRK